MKHLEEAFIGDLIWRDKNNRSILLLAVAGFIIQFMVFKMFYPYASFSTDSIDYLFSANWKNTYPTIRPLGYSKFLWFFTIFSDSDLLLVTLQYFFLQAARLYFLFTILSFFPPPRICKVLLIVYFLFDPLPLYLANYVLADALFTALSLLWFATLLKIIYQPNTRTILLNASLLLFLLTLRYNALYYPVCSFLAILLSKQKVWKKLWEILVNASVTALFIFYTINAEYNYTRIRQFSPFSGWQVANNALIMYQHIKPSKDEGIPLKYKVLYSMVRRFIDSSAIVGYRNVFIGVDSYYMWDAASPLTMYAINDWHEDGPFNFEKSFRYESKFYQEFGVLLIEKYPGQFVRYYIWPNFLNYVSPPLERMDYIAHPPKNMTHNIKRWHSSNQFYSPVPFGEHGPVHVLDWYPYFVAIINVCSLLMCLGFLIFKGVTTEPAWRQNFIWIMISLLLLNMAFSTYSAPIVLRYQIFPVIICFSFFMVTFNFIDLKK